MISSLFHLLLFAECQYRLELYQFTAGWNLVTAGKADIEETEKKVDQYYDGRKWRVAFWLMFNPKLRTPTTSQENLDLIDSMARGFKLTIHPPLQSMVPLCDIGQPILHQMSLKRLQVLYPSTIWSK